MNKTIYLCLFPFPTSICFSFLPGGKISALLSFVVQKVYSKTAGRSATKRKKKMVRSISHLRKVSDETMISKYRYVNCYHDSAIYHYLTRIVRSSRNCVRLLIRGTIYDVVASFTADLRNRSN